jgi:ferredoxin
MGYRLSVRKELCISSGKCVGDAPDLFRFDADELAEPVSPDTDASLDRLLKIARTCPGEAIIITDEHGAEVPLG